MLYFLVLYVVEEYKPDNIVVRWWIQVPDISGFRLIRYIADFSTFPSHTLPLKKCECYK
jgi:hypothetical protein